MSIEPCSVFTAFCLVVVLARSSRASPLRCASCRSTTSRGTSRSGWRCGISPTSASSCTTTAHPDDENNGLLVMLNRGQGYRTALATATRGNGGQNEIGPEIFEALGVLRTEELAALHRFDGAEQYFTRAVDFGYSFSIDETFEKWGRDEITARLRAADPHDPSRRDRHAAADRQRRRPASHGVGGHHARSVQARRRSDEVSRSRSRKACARGSRRSCITAPGSASPGEPPTSRQDDAASTPAVYDPLLGRTYTEIGTEARSMHKCQGMAQLLALPRSVGRLAISWSRRRCRASMQKDETSLFDGVDTQHRSAWRSSPAPRPPKDLTDGLDRRSPAPCRRRRRSSTATSDEATLQPLLDGLHAVRALRRAAARRWRSTTAGKYEIDFRLRQKERRIPAGDHCSPTASRSKRSPTMASSCRGSR